MASPSEVITLKASPDEIAAWKAAAAGPLSPWMRAKLNDAVAGRPSFDIEVIVQSAVAAALGAKNLVTDTEPTPGYVPTPIPPLPPGAKTVPINPDLADRNRQRGLVASFIRLRGKEWRGAGPDPTRFGCTVRPDVLAEYANQLEPLRDEMAALERLGLEPGTVVT